MTPMPRTFLALALALALLAGCLSDPPPPGPRADAPDALASEGASAKGWQAGNWWAYRATFEGDRTFHIALVVYDVKPDHFQIGSNLSAGFFGLPFTGNVTRPHLNPVVAGDEWRLFDFPLESGKTWEYPLFGYRLKATARAASVTAPHVGEHAGYELEATSYGQTVARYTYSPEVEWFTRLVIYEPTDGHEVVRVELEDFGEAYAKDYFVSVPLVTFAARYPDVPSEGRFTVDGDYLKLYANVALKGEVGEFRFTLKDPRGRPAMRAEVRPAGLHLAQEALDATPGSWTVDHLGLGQGSLRLEVTGVAPARQGRLVPTSEATFLPPEAPPPLRLGPFEPAAGAFPETAPESPPTLRVLPLPGRA